MPSLEITQAGINGIAAFDPFSNSPTSNFNYCNVYNVDPTTFNKTTFKSFTTASQQIAYLASNSTGARNGYATPPNFPYQGNANALNRVGNSGTTVANQPALRMNKVNTSQVNYLHQLATGYGDYYFNLLVIYNTINTLEVNRSADKNMPIAFIYLFDGMQFKSQASAIEINTVLAYTGIASTVEVVVNPTTTAQFLEVSSFDLLPTPTASPSNVYLVRNPLPPTDSKFNSTIATLDTLDYTTGTGAKNNVKLWKFEGYEYYIDVLTVADGGNTATKSAISDSRWVATSGPDNSGYFFQVLDGTYVGQCRLLSGYTGGGNNITWSTAFGGTIPTGITLRMYIPNKIILQNALLPSADDVTYSSSVRASSVNVTSKSFVYEGWGGNQLKPFPNTDLSNIPSVSANWRVTGSNTNIPAGFTGDGILTMIRDSTGFARQTLKELNASTIRVWERNINTSTLVATAWTDITAVPTPPVIPMPTLSDINANTFIHTDTIGFITMGGYNNNVLSGTTTAFTFNGLGLTPFPNKCFSVMITTGNLHSKNDNVNLVSKSTTGFTVYNTSSGDEMDMWFTAYGR